MYSWCPLDRRLGGPQEQVWTQMLQETFFVDAGDRTPVVQSVVTYYTDCATPAHGIKCIPSANKVRTKYRMPSRYLLRISPSNGFSEHGNNELLDFIKDGKLLDKVSNN
jgi:hypothetical protein